MNNIRGYRYPPIISDDDININEKTYLSVMDGFYTPQIPVEVFDIKNNESIKLTEIKHVNGTTHDLNGMTKKKDVTESGMYFVIATGSYYSYFNGEKWYGNDGINYEFKY